MRIHYLMINNLTRKTECISMHSFVDGDEFINSDIKDINRFLHYILSYIFKEAEYPKEVINIWVEHLFEYGDLFLTDPENNIEYEFRYSYFEKKE